MHWSPGSWRRFEARQQPDYSDPAALAAACAELARRPALVEIAAIDRLTQALAEAQSGRAFLLQAGDCAERLSEGPEVAAAMAALLARLSGELEAPGKPVVTVGRIGGQFAKPRSRPFETRDGTTLPAWRGDSVNDMSFDAEARRADPGRLIRAYDHGSASLARIPAPPVLYASHEALLLPFEEALVRLDPVSGRSFAGSGHFPWIGARTLFPGSANVELLRGLANPIGLKCGPELKSEAVLRLLDQLNPDRTPGRITLIVRLGHDRIGEALPKLLSAVRSAGQPVLWCCDPLHGNTMLDGSGRKRRRMADIEMETAAFFTVLAAERVPPGGLHLEMASRPVLECDEAHAATSRRDHDECRDPRLSPDQARRLTRIAAAALAGRVLGNPDRFDPAVAT
jgi:3-deoxy-7-phosphoheptulonate synthase